MHVFIISCILTKKYLYMQKLCRRLRISLLSCNYHLKSRSFSYPTKIYQLFFEKGEDETLAQTGGIFTTKYHTGIYRLPQKVSRNLRVHIRNKWGNEYFVQHTVAILSNFSTTHFATLSHFWPPKWLQNERGDCTGSFKNLLHLLFENLH